MKQDDALEILRQAHREEIPEAHYAAVRARVMAEIAAGHKPIAWWKWAACGLAAALALAAFVARPRHSAVVRPAAKQMIATVHEAPPPPAPAPRAKRKRTTGLLACRGLCTQPAVSAYRVVGPPVAQPPLVVKMLTDDPDVVIYWIASGGE